MAISVSDGQVLNYEYTGSVQSIDLPKGIYKLEVWGAQGGTYSTYGGGLGGYSVGVLTLETNTTLFIRVGGQPPTNSNDRVETEGGYNGGGKGFNRHYFGTHSYGQGGGGGTDFRIGRDSLYARVIVAGGGGGSSSEDSKTTKFGGGIIGGSPQSGYGATQTKGGISGNIGLFGQGGNVTTDGAKSRYGSGGGGGGWYGGAAGSGHSNKDSSYREQNGGGSGYIYTSGTQSNYPSGCLLNSKYYLAEAQTIAGNQSMPSPTGGTMTGRTGNGYARITVIKGSDTNLPVNLPVKVNGMWKETEGAYTNINGIWKEVESIFVNINGTWKEIG